MIKKPRFLKKDLHDNDWIGVVINNMDPEFAGRARVRVFRLMDNIQDDHLPWAYPINSTRMAGDGAGSLSVPKVGIIVRVQFNNGDISSPEYTTIQNIDTQMRELIREDYEGTHVLLYDPDEELNIIYQKQSGFQIFYKGSKIQITPDSMITLEHANTDSVIQLEGENCNIVTKNEINISAGSTVNINADEVVAGGNQATKIGGNNNYNHAILGEPLFALLQTMATALDAKIPVTPGVNAGLVQSAKQAVISKNVLISE